MTVALLCLPAAADSREELLRADLAFNQATARMGLDGWMSYFAEDAVFNGASGVIRGKAALRRHYAAMFARKGFSIRWKPLHAEASKDGSLGFTLGAATISWTDASGKAVSRDSRYLTVWRKLTDGTWRVVSDQGN